MVPLLEGGVFCGQLSLVILMGYAIDFICSNVGNYYFSPYRPELGIVPPEGRGMDYLGRHGSIRERIAGGLPRLVTITLVHSLKSSVLYLWRIGGYLFPGPLKSQNPPEAGGFACEYVGLIRPNFAVRAVTDGGTEGLGDRSLVWCVIETADTVVCTPNRSYAP
jgi:hypothetical protein